MRDALSKKIEDHCCNTGVLHLRPAGQIWPTQLWHPAFGNPHGSEKLSLGIGRSSTGLGPDQPGPLWQTGIRAWPTPPCSDWAELFPIPATCPNRGCFPPYPHIPFLWVQIGAYPPYPCPFHASSSELSCSPHTPPYTQIGAALSHPLPTYPDRDWDTPCLSLGWDQGWAIHPCGWLGPCTLGLVFAKLSPQAGSGLALSTHSMGQKCWEPLLWEYWEPNTWSI